MSVKFVENQRWWGITSAMLIIGQNEPGCRIFSVPACKPRAADEKFWYAPDVCGQVEPALWAERFLPASYSHPFNLVNTSDFLYGTDDVLQLSEVLDFCQKCADCPLVRHNLDVGARDVHPRVPKR